MMREAWDNGVGTKSSWAASMLLHDSPLVAPCGRTTRWCRYRSCANGPSLKMKGGGGSLQDSLALGRASSGLLNGFISCVMGWSPIVIIIGASWV